MELEVDIAMFQTGSCKDWTALRRKAGRHLSICTRPCRCSRKGSACCCSVASCSSESSACSSCTGTKQMTACQARLSVSTSRLQVKSLLVSMWTQHLAADTAYLTVALCAAMGWQYLLSTVFIHLFIHYMPSNPQIRCIAADILWQLSSLPCLGNSSTMSMKALQTAGLP